MAAAAKNHALAALWICTLFGYIGYQAAAAVQRCNLAILSTSGPTQAMSTDLWVICGLFCVSAGCALIWTQFTVSATVLVGTKLTRKAMLKQNVNPYSQM
jgi:hypothetical protein